MLILFAVVSVWALAAHSANTRFAADSVSVRVQRWGEIPSNRMAQSAHPVKLTVRGQSLRIVSKYEQVLPIYTNAGTLYLAMQLSPGTNWLNGLPRGRYLINNRTINIR